MKTMLRKTLTTLAFALGLTTFAFGDILTEQPYYWYKFDSTHNTSSGSANLGSFSVRDANINTVSPWGRALSLTKGGNGPYGGSFALPTGDWTYHVRAKLPANLDKGVIWCIGNWNGDKYALLLLTRANDEGLSLATANGKKLVTKQDIDCAGLSSAYHDITAVYSSSAKTVQLYVDGVATGDAFSYTSFTEGKPWQWLAPYGGLSEDGAVNYGTDTYLEEVRFYQKALTTAEIAELHDSVVTLQEDTTGLTGLTGKVVDLNGHKLTTTTLVGPNVIIDSSTGTPGQLIVNVAEGDTLENADVSISGNLKFVKEGAGTFSGSARNQCYTGGTEVNAGTIKSYDHEKYFFYGASSSTVTINVDGTLDINGKYDWNSHDIILNGGTIVNNGENQISYGYSGIGNLTLTADSTMSLLKHTLVNSPAKTSIDLGGHTLTVRHVSGTTDALLTFNNTKVFNGTIDLGEDIRFYPYGTTPDFTEANVVMAGSCRLTGDQVISNLLSNLNKADSQYTAAKKITITGTFKPVSQYLHNTVLANGATFDLTDKTEPVDVNGSLIAGQTISFAEGATITVDVSGRDLLIGAQVVAWNEKPADVSFQWDATTALKKVALVANDKGIYYGKVVINATWTNALGDDDITNPENWTCYDDEGKEIPGALPVDATNLTIADGKSIVLPLTDRTGGFTLGTGATLTIDFGEGKYIEGTALLTSSAGTIDIANGTVIVPDGTVELSPDAKQLRYLPAKMRVARWDFNNYDSEDPKSTNVLAATMGEAGVPCYHPGAGSEEIEDLGEMSVTNVIGEAGNYAIAIPTNYHVRLPLPKTLQRGDWTIRMRFFTPEASDKQFRTFFSRDNTDDGDLFINKSNLVGGGGKIVPSQKYYGSPIEKEKWHLLTVSQRNGYGAVCVDGEQSYTWTGGSKWNFFFDKDYLYLCADENGDDGLLFVDYIELDVEPPAHDSTAIVDGILTRDVVLTNDQDWSAITISSLNNKTIDLAGYSLTISSTTGTGKAYDSTTDAENPGSLVVNVAEGATYTNEGLALAGNLKLVKNGAGAFVGAVKNQTYTGGTVINEGSISVTGTKSETEHYFGPRYTGVTINPDGILDIKRNYSWCYHPIVLNGGTINNTAATYTDSAQGLGDITLTADSKMTIKYHTTFKQNDRDGVVNLGGHTLSVEYVTNPSDDKAILHFNGSTVTNGTMVFGKKTKFNPLTTTNIGENVTLVMNGDFFLQKADVTVLNLEDASMGHSQTLQNDRRVHVAGRYTPNSEYLVNVTLKDGATLDLTGKTEAWEFVNTLTPQTLAFEDGATITVDVSGRDLTKGDQVVVWRAKPENVTFQWDDTTKEKGVEISVTESGIFYGQVIATAHWTNKLGDGDTTNPENWACTNASGVAVSAVPTEATTAYFTGDAIVAQVTNETTWGAVSFDGALGADCDWSGLGSVNFTDSSIDLKGRTLTIGSLAEGTAAVSITNSAAGGAFALSDGTTKLRDGLTISKGVTVYIGGEATLDTNGKQAETKFALRFADGATLVNTGADVGDTIIQFAGGITLDENATATFDLANAVNLVASGYGEYPIALNGGTLLIDNHNDNFSIANGVITGPGTIEAKGAKQFNVGYKGMSIADDVVLKVTKPGWIWAVTGATTIPTIVGDGKVNCRTYAYTVTKSLAGSLTLDDMAKGLYLGNGAALDLSMLDDVYAQFGKIKTTAGHTYVINLAGRELEPDTKVISWTAIPTDVTFVWDEETAKAGENVVLKEDGLYYGADHASKVVDKAYWTGAASGDAMNPANWGCTNQAGYVVVDGIPTNTEATVILNNPLAVDCDWTGLGAFAFAKNSLVDLNGHRLAVADFANRTTGIVVTNTVETTGDFVIKVAEGATAENSTVAILGNVRLVKEGAGTFASRVQQQLYTGGTVISNGTIKATNYEKFYLLGKKGTDITIEPNGTLDLNGWYDWEGHRIVLAGGTLQNTGSSMTSTSYGGLGDVVLTADSRMKLKYHTLFNDNNATRYVDLGGYTLTADYIECTDPKAIVYVNHNTFKNGTLVMNPGIVLRPVSATGVSGADFTLVVNGDIAPTVSDYTIESVVDNSEGRVTDGTHVGTITKYYKPASTNFQNFVLADGATLDLTAQTEAWSTASALEGKSVTFAENATNTVDLTGRTIAQDDKIIAWTTQPTDTTTFVFKGCELAPVAEEDGLYARQVGVVPGEPIEVPTGAVPEEFRQQVEANKATLLKAPENVLSGEALTDYQALFTATLTQEGSTVNFVLNADGTNAVETATAAAKTEALDVALSEESTFTVADPLPGFYYSFKQGGDVKNLDFRVATDQNKLAGRDTIEFTLVKEEGASFYQTIITPTPTK